MSAHRRRRIGAAAGRVGAALAHAAVAVTVLAGAVGVVLTPAGGVAAQTPPLTATLALKEPVAADLIFPLGASIPMVLVIENTSGGELFTTENFSRSDFFRRLVFVDTDGNLVTNATEAGVLRESPQTGFCFSRGGVLLLTTALAVVPVEVLPGPPAPFLLEFTLDDVRKFYDLSRPGRYTVSARIPVRLFDPADPQAVIADCDQFAGTTLVNVATGLATENLLVESNALEFFVTGDANPPASSVALAPPANGAGWNRTNVTATVQATDDAGVKEIEYALTGAQTGSAVVPGDVAVVTISAEGTTSLSFFARDTADNVEDPALTATVHIDRTAPELALTCSPREGTVVATGRDALSGLAAVARGGTAAAPTFLASDRADNTLLASLTADVKTGQVEFALGQLAYNDGPPAPLAANEVTCGWAFDRNGAVSTFRQTLRARGAGGLDIEATAKYDSRKDQTEIRIKRTSGAGFEVIVRPGVVAMKLTTSQGVLGVDF